MDSRTALQTALSDVTSVVQPVQPSIPAVTVYKQQSLHKTQQEVTMTAL